MEKQGWWAPETRNSLELSIWKTTILDKTGNASLIIKSKIILINVLKKSYKWVDGFLKENWTLEETKNLIKKERKTSISLLQNTHIRYELFIVLHMGLRDIIMCHGKTWGATYFGT